MASTPPPPHRHPHGSARAAAPTASRRTTDQLPVLPPFEVTSTLLDALRAQVDHSLKYYLYANAIFYAERLFDQCPSHRNLHTLAHCHVASGDTPTALRLLLHYYPYFFQREQTLESAVTALVRTGGAAAAASYVAALWDCQYLLGVCCCRTQRYGEGHDVLRELAELCTLLPNVAFCGRPGYVSLQEALRTKERPMYHPKRKAGGGNSNEEDEDSGRGESVETALWFALAGHNERSAELTYWIGTCEQQMPVQRHQNTTTAAEYFRVSVQKNKLLFCSLEGYLKTVAQPSADFVEQLYSTPSSSSVAPGGRESELARVLRPYLFQFARALHLGWTYQCGELQEWLKLASFPKAIAGRPSAAAVTAAATGGPQPQRPSAWQLTWLSLARFHEGNMQASAESFQQLLTTAPWRLQDPALIYYSTALWHLKDASTLGALAQSLLEELPLAATTLAIVANMYSLSKEPKEAIEMLTRATQVDPALAYAHALRGYELLYLDYKTEAEEAFRRAIQADFKLYIAYAGLGELLFRTDKLEAAREYFCLAIQLNPSPAIMNRYAATYNKRDATAEELREALRIYTASIRTHAHNAPARHQRADVLLRLRRVDEAYEQLQQLAQTTQEAMVFVSLARCLECMGRPQEAVVYYHKAMVLDPRREVYIKGCLENLASGDTD